MTHPSPRSEAAVHAEQVFRRSRSAVPRSRRFVRAVIADHASGHRLQDILLCASELATNALHHTPPGRLFRVCVVLAAGLLRIEVHDTGDGAPRVCEAAPEGEGGRGLLLVAALADDWGTARRDGPGKSVWAAFRLPAVGAS